MKTSIHTELNKAQATKKSESGQLQKRLTGKATSNEEEVKEAVERMNPDEESMESRG